MHKLNTEHKQEATLQHSYICFGLKSIKDWSCEVYKGQNENFKVLKINEVLEVAQEL